MHDVLQPLADFTLTSIGALVVVAYAVVIGGVFGSFLNVVAYRLPLGMNLSRPGSRCPKCLRPIRLYHNVPVLGWLILRGRCRDCGAPIAPRYPLVEFAVAAACGLVCWMSLTASVSPEGWTYSVNLPAVVLRLMLIVLLFCTVLLEFDGNRLPLRTLLFSVALVALLEIFFPQLRPQPPEELAGAPWATQGFSLAAAAVLGLIAWPLLCLPIRSTARDAVCRLLLLVLVALVLGGMATLATAVLAAALLVVFLVLSTFWPPGSRLGWAASLLIATLLWFLAAGPELGSNEMATIGERIFVVSDPWQALVPVGVILAALSLLGRAIHYVAAGRPRSAN